MTHYDCKACYDTGKCPNCGGQGCMDCKYTGECQQCQESEDLRIQEYEYNSLVNQD